MPSWQRRRLVQDTHAILDNPPAHACPSPAIAHFSLKFFRRREVRLYGRHWRVVFTSLRRLVSRGTFKINISLHGGFCNILWICLNFWCLVDPTNLPRMELLISEGLLRKRIISPGNYCFHFVSWPWPGSWCENCMCFPGVICNFFTLKSFLLKRTSSVSSKACVV